MGHKKGSKKKEITKTEQPIVAEQPLQFLGSNSPEETAPPEHNKRGRGVVLLALGHPMYGRMAANLASSIRYSDKDIPIHLIHSGVSISHLTPQHLALFTSIAECPVSAYTKNDKTVYLKAKTCIYDLSPFEETIMLDVDLIWFANKNVSSVFDSLKDVDFTIQNRGYADMSKEVLDKSFCMWCDINEVRKEYDCKDRFYLLASEVVYFKRTADNEKYFSLVKDIFDNPKIAGSTFAADLPDEFAFDIASAVMKKYPHKDNWVLIYWFATEKNMTDFNKILQEYYGYSLGGSVAPDAVLNRYDMLARFYAKALKLPTSFKAHNKRKLMAERKQI